MKELPSFFFWAYNFDLSNTYFEGSVQVLWKSVSLAVPSSHVVCASQTWNGPRHLLYFSNDIS